MLFGEDSRLPVFPRVYSGSTHDVSTLAGMATFINQIKLDQMHFVMDKGFYSLKGITPFLEDYTKFAIGVPFLVDKSKELVDLDCDIIDSADNAIMIGNSIYYVVTHTEMLKNRRVTLSYSRTTTKILSRYSRSTVIRRL